jgi:molecular chaperone GrpE
MTDEQIETILNDFRGWLRENADQPMEPLATLSLVNEFTALRHEVKLLTKATRGQSEQVAAVLEQLSDVPSATEVSGDDELRPALLAFLEAADTLNRAVAAIERLAVAPRPSMWRRWFIGSSGTAAGEQLAALADGLKLSQQRLAATLSRLELVPVAAIGEPFDPETMEALDAVAGNDQPSGRVLEEVRTGYCWRGRVLRYAQVRVAK